MKLIKNSFILFLLALFVVSCSNDSDDVSPTPYQVRENRITKEISANTTKTYTYNANNQLIKIIEIGDLGSGMTQSVENLTYTNGVVSEVKIDYTGSSSYGFKYAYTYDTDGKLVVINVERYIGSAGYSNFSFVAFDYATPNIVERYEQRAADSTATLTYYNLTNGNTTSSSVYTGVTANTPNGQLNNTTVYSDFDGKKSPYPTGSLVYREPYRFVNNPGRSESSGSTVTYTYEYNEDGYVAKKTTSFNNTTNSITYVYEKI